MAGPLLKFFNERGGADSEHHGQLHWPGTASGFPYRGQPGQLPPMLRGAEYEDRVQHVTEFKSRQFSLWEPEDKKDFDSVMDRITAGWYYKINRIDRWSETYCGLIVWLEWLQIYGESVDAKVPGQI
jgi:hypothetical protein